MHKKCKINVHVCEKNKYMDSNEICEVIKKSSEAKEENLMTLTRGRQTVRFTEKNSNANKPIFQDHIIFQINDDSPLYKYFLVFRSHIKIYEKQSPGSNLVYVNFLYSQFFSALIGSIFPVSIVRSFLIFEPRNLIPSNFIP